MKTKAPPKPKLEEVTVVTHSGDYKKLKTAFLKLVERGTHDPDYIRELKAEAGIL